MFKGTEIYKERSFAEKIAVMPAQVRGKIQYMVSRGEHLTVTGATIILVELCVVLLGLGCSEHFSSTERKPNKSTLLCFLNLAGTTWDLGDMTKKHSIAQWANRLSNDEYIKVRLYYTKHQRHRVMNEVICKTCLHAHVLCEVVEGNC